MSLYVPETQAAFPFTGTFLADDGLGNVGIINAIAGARGMGLYDGGDFMLLGGEGVSRPPLGWGGTGTVPKDYTSDLAAGTYEIVTGAFALVTITEKRDYIVLVTFQWYWNSANWSYQHFRITANGSATGIFPAYYYKQRDTNPSVGEAELANGVFYLRQWQPGTYLIQLQHTPAGSAQNRYVEQAQIVVL